MSFRRAVQFCARDGVSLAGTLFETASSKPSALLLMNSATAVPQTFYGDFCEHVATNHHYPVLSYDYRGIGQSRPTVSLRNFEAKMSDWVLDMAGAVDWMREEYPSCRRLYMVGHSVGGQIAGLLPPEMSQSITAMVTISSQSGYWKLQGDKLSVCFHVHVTLPVLANLLGYMPWSFFTTGAQDLPKDVALQWSQWCRQPGYLLDDETLQLENYQEFTSPTLAYSIDDDSWGTARSVDSFMLRAYPKVERQHLCAKNYGIDYLGHFGYFKPKASVLWDEAIQWLHKQP